MGPRRAASPREKPTRDLPDLPLSRRSLEVGVRREGAAQNAGDVRVDELGPTLIGERRDRAGGVFANTWQLTQSARLGRKRAVRRRPALRHFTREPMEVAGARIVAESFPGLTHLTGARAREVGEVRESIEESAVVIEHAGHLRLLQHQLGDEDAIRIPGPSPREITAVRTIPRAQQAAERLVTRGWVAGIVSV